jgi:hypothetical protein
MIRDIRKIVLGIWLAFGWLEIGIFGELLQTE